MDESRHEQLKDEDIVTISGGSDQMEGPAGGDTDGTDTPMTDQDERDADTDSTDADTDSTDSDTDTTDVDGTDSGDGTDGTDTGDTAS
jgi:hypothetical protein